MTSEICMMNRLAVILAADSATTVSRWNDGKREERYFKGANKVFQLSDMQPVGLMIFDSADILNVPWELIIKSFRSHIKNNKYNTVDDYAKELFTYLSDNPRFFPIEVQNEALLNAGCQLVLAVMMAAIKDVAENEKLGAISAAFLTLIDDANRSEIPECIDEATVEKAIKDVRSSLEEFILETMREGNFGELKETPQAAAAALREVIVRSEYYLETTGLVFAGFGEHEIFPAMVEYESRGVVGGKHLYSKKGITALDHGLPAYMQAFAQTSMIDTFNSGVSFDVYGSIMQGIDQKLRAFAIDVLTKAGSDETAVADLEDLISDARGKIGAGIIDKARKEHSMPLRSVLSVLPANEMAELAETLITLQSLKEKVTKPSETVGGPVDVAIITKNEGLVWVKRKHFFEPKLNVRFSLRQAAQHS